MTWQKPMTGGREVGAAALALPAAPALAGIIPQATKAPCPPPTDEEPDEQPSEARQAKQRTAARLTALTGGQVEVYYTGGMYLDDDADGAGHIFSDFVVPELNGVFLDDRRPEPLEAQLAAELRRVSAWYADMARLVEANCR